MTTSPLRVAFDISDLGMHFPASATRRGIERVVEQLLGGLAQSPEVDLALTATHAAKGVALLRSADPSLARLPLLQSAWQERLGSVSHYARTYLRNTISDRRWHQRLYRRALLETSSRLASVEQRIPPRLLESRDIFHSLFNGIPKTLRALPRLQKFLTVYDLIPILEPEKYRSGGGRLQRALASLQKNDWVLCISESVKENFCDHLNFDPSRVFVTYLAASRETFYPCRNEFDLTMARSRYQIPAEAPYLLSLSAVEPRKNLSHLIRCFGRMVESMEVPDLYLVLVGNPLPSEKAGLLTQIADAGLSERVILTGFVPDADLAAIYSGALSFVFPSLAEGFGLPPLEAMQCGVPVISSNTTSLPEVVGDAALLVDPSDEDALCQSILQIYRSRALQEQLSMASLSRAAKFSWERCVQQTISAYQIAVI